MIKTCSRLATGATLRSSSIAGLGSGDSLASSTAIAHGTWRSVDSYQACCLSLLLITLLQTRSRILPTIPHPADDCSWLELSSTLGLASFPFLTPRFHLHNPLLEGHFNELQQQLYWADIVNIRIPTDCGQHEYIRACVKLSRHQSQTPHEVKSIFREYGCRPMLVQPPRGHTFNIVNRRLG